MLGFIAQNDTSVNADVALTTGTGVIGSVPSNATRDNRPSLRLRHSLPRSRHTDGIEPLTQRSTGDPEKRCGFRLVAPASLEGSRYAFGFGLSVGAWRFS